MAKIALLWEEIEAKMKKLSAPIFARPKNILALISMKSYARKWTVIIGVVKCFDFLSEAKNIVNIFGEEIFG